MANYYDGTKLLSLKDINGNVPEIYICTTNRTGGKTTYFGRLVVISFFKISALVAEVPIPLPLIWARSSSSSISCPAFSIAKIMEPEL